jgi:uncharacterized protein (TIGR03086 family)
MPTELVSQLSLALDITGRLIAAVPGGQWADPTPCPGWSVRDLVAHLVAGNSLFASALRGEPLPPAQGTSRPDGDLPGAYRDSAATLLDAFRQPGVLERVVSVPFGSVPGAVALHLRITEVLVHGWDLARATRQSAAFPEDLAEQELAFSRAKLADIPGDRQPFAPPQPVPADAAAIDRLAACLGREAAWQAPSPGSA